MSRFTNSGESGSWDDDVQAFVERGRTPSLTADAPPAAPDVGRIVLGPYGEEVHAATCGCWDCGMLAVADDGAPSPVSAAWGVPAFDGDPKIVPVPRVDRGWYRVYDLLGHVAADAPAGVQLDVPLGDARQIAWELVRESPVVGQVAFRLIGDRVAAQLTSYVAFA